MDENLTPISSHLCRFFRTVVLLHHIDLLWNVSMIRNMDLGRCWRDIVFVVRRSLLSYWSPCFLKRFHCNLEIWMRHDVPNSSFWPVSDAFSFSWTAFNRLFLPHQLLFQNHSNYPDGPCALHVYCLSGRVSPDYGIRLDDPKAGKS